jgi:Kinesin motor domain
LTPCAFELYFNIDFVPAEQEETYCFSVEETLNSIEKVSRKRRTSKTMSNLQSLRSHAIITISATTSLPNKDVKKGIFTIVDLAGSEVLSKSGVEGEALLVN